MKHSHVFYVLIFLLLTSLTEGLDYAKKECKDKCGDVMIPYPFGIGPNCSINKWYTVDCNSSTAYLSAFNNLELLYVDLEAQTIIVNASTIFSRGENSVQGSYSTPSIDLSESPFVFASSLNILVVVGCGHAAILFDEQPVNIGCSTICPIDATDESEFSLGICYCRAPVPVNFNLKSYSVDLTRLKRLGRSDARGFAFLVDKILFQGWNLDDVLVVKNNSNVPVSLMWTLTDNDLHEVPNCWERTIRRSHRYVGNGSYVEYGKCFCGIGRVGNPYLHYQCEESEDCKKCKDSGGICHYEEIYLDDWRLSCEPTVYYSRYTGSNKSPIGAIIGVSICMGMLFLAKFIYELHKIIKKTIADRRKEKFFKRNGGLLLTQQVATKAGLVDKTILFTSKELEMATDHYNENRILGRGGQGTVYKGMLSDGKIVAVKKSKIVDESQLEQFVNEVVILSQVNHRNVVKLLGCCLETEVPLLISEFVSNGTLYDFIQDDTREFTFSLNMRLKIATEIAGALSYLHSATSIPIYHRDIKTTNILLDEKYRAKVSDFGISRFISIDQTHLTTLVKGTFGYLDPEYLQSSQFTEKSDVYSFGVVLLELLTGERPISLTRFGEHRNLATHFMFAMEEGRVMSIFDPVVVNKGSNDELLAIANLAMRCLNFNGRYRPTMKEVALELERMRISQLPPELQTNFGVENNGEDARMLSYANSQ